MHRPYSTRLSLAAQSIASSPSSLALIASSVSLRHQYQQDSYKATDRLFSGRYSLLQLPTPIGKLVRMTDALARS